MATKPTWPMHSSQTEAIKSILDAGGTVSLTYQVKPVTDVNKKLEAEFKGKQRL